MCLMQIGKLSMIIGIILIIIAIICGVDDMEVLLMNIRFL